MDDIMAYLKKNDCQPAPYGLFEDCKYDKVNNLNII